MPRKVLVTLYGNDVAPRFDLTIEVFIASVSPEGRIEEEKTVVLPQASAEKLCRMIITEDIQTVICGAIEEEYFEYLRWKRIEVLDSVIGSCRKALEKYIRKELVPRAIFWEKPQNVLS
ncbi:MAG: dinitrogenase iron-molybdenum cofactor biosynthesis protein [Deltaproteobacteria bacterium]|jgi:predicted Fe-Mo cluster-binding NifX family protein|nr:dinitrogenase iron-molybdenum cofactor biosynthesis protein [Deltaproteobacteria bacterium]